MAGPVAYGGGATPWHIDDVAPFATVFSMADWAGVLRRAGRALAEGWSRRSGRGTAGTARPKAPRAPRPTAPRPPRGAQPTAGAPSGLDGYSPGRHGPDATVEVDPHRIGAVRMDYRPDRDGDPDPGEIVWTWVPFEENDGRGKDRPVLVVARDEAETVLTVQLTSKEHRGSADFIPIGTGAWDGERRPSWVNIDRVFRVHTSGMRREAAALGRARFDRVGAALRARYGWR